MSMRHETDADPFRRCLPVVQTEPVFCGQCVHHRHRANPRWLPTKGRGEPLTYTSSFPQIRTYSRCILTLEYGPPDPITGAREVASEEACESKNAKCDCPDFLLPQRPWWRRWLHL